MKPTSRLEIITPKKALKYLEHNLDNRKPSLYYVDEIAGMLERGEWVITGHSVSFRSDGVLVDGQQRLMACVKSGIPFETFVVRGLGMDAFHGTDRMRIRSAADITKLPSKTTQTIKAYNVYLEGGKSRMSHQQIFDIYKPRFIQFDEICENRPHKKGIGAAPLWACLVYYYEHNVKALDFMNAILSPTDVIQANVLKDYLFFSLCLTGGQAQKQLVANALYCMDAHMKNKKIKNSRMIGIEEAFV
jgi:hypothetical protein